MRYLTMTLLALLCHGALVEAQSVASRKQLTMAGAEKVAGAVVAEARRLNTTGVVAVVVVSKCLWRSA